MTRTAFDKVSLLYDFVEKYVLKDYQGSLDILNKHLQAKNNEKLIDIGGGTGYITKALRTKNDEITIVDPARRMLRKMNEPAIAVLQADGAILPLHNNVFDLAFFVNTLHHIEEKKQIQVLQETYRILKSQGRIFIIEVWYPHTFSVRMFTKFEEFIVGKTHHRSPDELSTILKEIGFHDVTTFFPKKHNWKYVAMATKK